MVSTKGLENKGEDNDSTIVRKKKQGSLGPARPKKKDFMRAGSERQWSRHYGR